jgi:hypothetical protein
MRRVREKTPKMRAEENRGRRQIKRQESGLSKKGEEDEHGTVSRPKGGTLNGAAPQE